MASGRDVRDMLGLPMGGDAPKSAQKRAKPSGAVRRIRMSYSLGLAEARDCVIVYVWLTSCVQRVLRAKLRRYTVKDHRRSPYTKRRKHTEQNDRALGLRRNGTDNARAVG
jgi:hypothetical protein